MELSGQLQNVAAELSGNSHRYKWRILTGDFV